jgi:hypothetical protein
MKLVNWKNTGDAKAGDAGFWSSRERRFTITPNYIGRTTAQTYELFDALTGEKYTHYTVGSCKTHAERILVLEWKRG